MISGPIFGQHICNHLSWSHWSYDSSGFLGLSPAKLWLGFYSFKRSLKRRWEPDMPVYLWHGRTFWYVWRMTFRDAHFMVSYIKIRQRNMIYRALIFLHYINYDLLAVGNSQLLPLNVSFFEKIIHARSQKAVTNVLTTICLFFRSSYCF